MNEKINILTEQINSINLEDYDIAKIIYLQSRIRGYLYRKNHIPNSIEFLKNVLQNTEWVLSTSTRDGRTNSCIDEDRIMEILIVSGLSNRMKIPKKRHWFDFSIHDYRYGWLPVNIKSTTTLGADNTGNFAMCVHALTNVELDLDKMYKNGEMSKLLITKIKTRELNYIHKKDYYFIIINKNTKQVTCNSFKGLKKLTANINNLPFQIKWSNNKRFKYRHINKVLKKFINVIKKPTPSWREEFLNEFRKIQ